MSNDVVIVVRADDKASKTFKDVGDSASGLGKTLGNVGQIAGGFLAANVIAGAGQKLVGFFDDSVNAAKDLGESVNAVDKIFGDQSQTILDWGKNNATQFGLSQRSFNQLATPLGAMLKNSGIEDFSGATIDLTKRAADMASVFNVDVEEALTAIQAGLRGESDPLERFGVGLSAAKVEARAMADTGKTVASSLTDQEKATARLAIIMDQTASVQGDFADTSDELANKQRIQQARAEELSATLGAKLLPIQLKITEAKLALVEVLTNKVIPVLEELYAKHWPAVSEAINKVVAFIQANWPLISDVIGFVFDYVKTRIEGFIQMAGAIIEIVTSVVNLVSDLFHGRWSQAWGEMKDIAGAIIDLVIGNIKSQFGNIPEIILGLAGDAASAAGDFAQGMFDRVIDILSGLPAKMRQLGKDAANAFLDSISVAGISAGDVVGLVGGLIPGRAGGGPAGGLTWVGERGPELVNLPGGSHVYSNPQSRAMASKAGGSGDAMQPIVVNVYGSILSERDITRVMRDAIMGGAFHGLIGRPE